jgi:hypothetical protein
MASANWSYSNACIHAAPGLDNWLIRQRRIRPIIRRRTFGSGISRRRGQFSPSRAGVQQEGFGFAENRLKLGL